MTRWKFTAILCLLLLTSGILTAQDDETEFGERPPFFTPVIIASFDHDPNAFTQGLLLHDGLFYESAGQYGESTLRLVDPATGEVLQSIQLDDEFFAEGLERIDNRLIQLTWQENVAFVYDLDTFEQLDSYTYDGEGWGLCYNGEYLYMSDGTPFISVRDPETFDLIAKMLVTFEGVPISTVLGQPPNRGLLNELECVGDKIYSNILGTDFIAIIDKVNGNIIGMVDAKDLIPEAEREAVTNGGVLNGIAYNPDAGTFYITGKDWSQLFEVQFEQVEE